MINSDYPESNPNNIRVADSTKYLNFNKDSNSSVEEFNLQMTCNYPPPVEKETQIKTRKAVDINRSFSPHDKLSNYRNSLDIQYSLAKDICNAKVTLKPTEISFAADMEFKIRQGQIKFLTNKQADWLFAIWDKTRK